MQVNCSQCDFSTEIDAALLPVSGMEGRCPCCRCTIPLGAWGVVEPPEQATPPDTPPTATSVIDEPEEEGRVSLINIIALLFIIDSTLSLIKLVPGFAEVVWYGAGLNFHLRAKYLYDTCIAALFFVSVFGLLTQKNWARIAFIWLLSLGLAEGLYFLIYQQFAIVELEQNLHESFTDLKQQQAGSLIGCLLYAFFIFKLNSRKFKARFRCKTSTTGKVLVPETQHEKSKIMSKR